MWIALSCVLAAVAIVIGYFGLKWKSPMYYIAGTNEVSPSPINKYEDLELRFRGERINAVTLTRICLWNAGRELILKEHIAPKDSVRVVSHVPSGARPLACEVVACSTAVLNASVKQQVEVHDNPFAEDPDQQHTERVWFDVSFDFLAHNDWILLHVLHTGSKPDDFWLEGTVMGCKHGIRRLPPEAKSNICVFLPKGVGLLIAAMSLLMVLGLVGIGYQVAHGATPAPWVMLVVAVPIVLTWLGMLRLRLLYRIPRKALSP